MRRPFELGIALGLGLIVVTAAAQPPGGVGRPEPGPVPERPGPGGFGPRGFGPPGFGPGGAFGGKRNVVADFDRDGDGRLNREERQAARDSLRADRESHGGREFGPRGGFRGPGRDSGPPGGFGPPQGLGPPPGFPPGGRGERQPAQPGVRISPEDVEPVRDAALYDPAVLRTLFIDFDSDDWEAELADFRGTDVEVPATLTVDGRQYPNVGVHFRGMSSYGMVPAGYKRPLNLSLDFVEAGQRLYGYKTLNLLNSHGDPSFLSTVLYSHIARQYIPAPNANLVRVVINGENWGIYANAQQFNKEFLAENYPSTKGVHWKVPGSPAGGGGLEYLGEDIEAYRRRYELKTGDGEKAWRDLIALCRTLNETPLDELEQALEPILDIDGALKFLALDVALINNDGYWVRASDYSLFRDKDGARILSGGAPLGGGPLRAGADTHTVRLGRGAGRGDRPDGRLRTASRRPAGTGRQWRAGTGRRRAARLRAAIWRPAGPDWSIRSGRATRTGRTAWRIVSGAPPAVGINGSGDPPAGGSRLRSPEERRVPPRARSGLSRQVAPAAPLRRR
ncbi:MAG TPA: CotH kinase family protein [Planctomycetaceae bacterium]|nr:CotH kinase family protein [Planctomycetaceae bacterium]